MAYVTAKNGEVEVKTPYSANFVAALKALVPATQRSWQPTDKTWLVDVKYAKPVIDLVKQFWASDDSSVANLNLTSTPTKAEKVVEVHYLGRAKPRPDGQVTATGFADGGWNVVIPKSVLLAWFNTTDDRQDHYQRLGIKHNFTPDELKQAFRRLAMQWHPDRCKEPNAEATFKAINEAHQVLGDTLKRYDYDLRLAKHDAGKHFEQMLKQTARVPQRDRKGLASLPENEWAPPLRSGNIKVAGTYQGGRLVVEKILAWDDITDASGRVLVSSWASGMDTFTETWVVK